MSVRAVSQQSEAVLAMIRELQARDQVVRGHEAAHQATGGGLVTSGPHYSFQKGPDGKNYAVGGEVGIDTSPAASPQATIAKMAQVRAAALAPAQPSGQDLSVAAEASQQEAAARIEAYRDTKETDKLPEPGSTVNVSA